MSGSEHTPFQDITNRQKQDPKDAKRQRNREWYEKNKDEISKRRREARELKKHTSTPVIDENTPSIVQSGVTQQLQCLTPTGVSTSGSSYSGQTNDLTTRISTSVMLDEDYSDWLHSNLTCVRDVISQKKLQNTSTSPVLHRQDSFVETNADSEKRRQRASSEHKWQRERQRYSSMTDGQKDLLLHNNREYKKKAREHNSQPSRNNQIDPRDTDCNEDPDPTGIFEPVEQSVTLEDNMDTILHDPTIHDDDDEECRIFIGQGDVFNSWQVASGVAPSNQNDDPYDYVYHNLPTKHHVLKPMPDCVHCGAMKLQYEGPAFCCRKGKVKIVTPQVPQELRRLFTSQVDDDAKYFRKHIRYFNSHFSFTSLGVTLDKSVSNAARTSVYTFRAQGELYYRMDDLVPDGQGPRHLQLYFYDTDETLEHRVKRSPDLDINIIRKILKILENNPYVQTFKSIGSVPNLEEYRISLNTDIRLDQRRYNAPTASQVAAMWVEGSDPHNTFDRQVVLFGRGDRPIFIRAYYGCYDPLAYPLFFPGGETGWNRWLPYEKTPSSDQENNEDGTEGDDFTDQDHTSDLHVEDNTDDIPDDEDGHEDDEGGSSRKFVSAREYYCFKAQVRKGLFNIILFGARGFQQWAVDMYIKMETMRLDFYSKPKNQKLIRADLYQLIN